MFRSNAKRPLLSSITNGMGGTTTITYTPSSAWVNTMLPHGMIMQTVSALTTIDGRGTSSTVNYQYAGGLEAMNEETSDAG